MFQAWPQVVIESVEDCLLTPRDYVAFAMVGKKSEIFACPARNARFVPGPGDLGENR